MLQEQYDDLSRLCDRKPELLNSEEALIALEHLVYEEVGAKSSNPGCVNQSKMFVLRERLSEFKKIHKNMNLKSRCDMDAISNVLECAETLNAYLNCKAKNQVSHEIVKIDTRILREVSMLFLRAHSKNLSENISVEKFEAGGATSLKEKNKQKRKKQRRKRTKDVGKPTT
ncbi:hypothetical protein NL676_003199 [Syzygium grande]|nr:hypothetical protein NL676_003199 [Syzygium grande]